MQTPSGSPPLVNTGDQTRRFTAADLQCVKQATFIREIEHHTAIPSTNSRALEMAVASPLQVPLLVLTDQQTAGRGRGANRWWSAPGALTFSVILDGWELDDASNWPRISLTTGIAICEAVHQLCPGLDAGVKWPNDVYVRNRKVCGILVEVPPAPCRRLVVGVGVNVNNSFRQAPPSMQSVGTSLLDVAGYSFSLTTALVAMLQQLSAHLTLLQREPERLLQRWQDFCMLAGRRVQIDAGTRRIVGVCQGINARGALLVETETSLEQCLSGVVTLVD